SPTALEQARARGLAGDPDRGRQQTRGVTTAGSRPLRARQSKGPGEVDRRGLAARCLTLGGSIRTAAATVATDVVKLTTNPRKRPHKFAAGRGRRCSIVVDYRSTSSHPHRCKRAGRSFALACLDMSAGARKAGRNATPQDSARRTIAWMSDLDLARTVT